MDENFVAKLLDVGSELSFSEGEVLVEPDEPRDGLLLILQGVLTVVSASGEDERGPGQTIGQWERLDGTDEVRVIAVTDGRLLAVDRSAYEAALTG